MRTGRPNKGAGHVDNLAGETMEKARLRAILQTLSGELSVDEACERLGIQRAYFQELRERALQGALVALQPLRPGRPPRAATAGEQAELERLRHEKAALEDELEIFKVRLELMLTMPDLLRPPAKGGGTKSG